jgi:hypothetical protein
LKVKSEGWDCLGMIKHGTEAREYLLEGKLKSENDKSQKSYYQQVTLADIHLEQFLFVKFSEAL